MGTDTLHADIVTGSKVVLRQDKEPVFLCETKQSRSNMSDRHTHRNKTHTHTLCCPSPWRQRQTDRCTWDRHEDTIDLELWLSRQEVGRNKNIAMQYRSKKKWDFLFGRVESGGVASPILTVFHGWVGSWCKVRWVGGCRGMGGVAGVGRREDSPRLRVFLSNNNVIRIIHPRIPVTEESLSVNTGS